LKFTPTKSYNPFVGLRPFESHESLLFFGRRDQTITLLERLHHQRFLAILGSSGCGKSSLIRAGLIPKLKAGMLVGDRDKWFIATMKPGDKPWQNLANALSSVLLRDINLPRYQERTLEEEMFESDMPAIINTFKPLLNEADANLLLLVDQFEEIFRFSKIRFDSAFEEQSADFISIILSLANQRILPIYVVITMRSDFLGECDHFFGLPEAINESIYLVPRLSRKQRREAIEGPIHLLGQEITPRLLDRLLNDAGDESDQLPVLQHALMRTWNNWQQNGEGPLDIDNYRAIGTLHGALSMDAENALRGMSKEELTLTEQIFQALTDTDPGNRQIRHPAHLSEIVAITEADREKILEIIERFRSEGRSFLILSEGDENGDYLIDISHESLIRQWRRLREWVEKESEARSMYQRLVESATLHKDEKAGLWRDPELQLGLEWQEKTRPNKAWAKRYSKHFEEAINFLQQSKIVKDKELAAKRKKIILSVLLSLVAILIIVVSIVFYYRQKAEQETKMAKLGEQLFIEKQQKKAAQEKVEQNRKITIADSLRSQGNNAVVASEYQDALTHYNQALQLYQELDKSNESISTLIDLGKVHVLTNSYKMAKEFFTTALDSSLSHGDKYLEGEVLKQFASLSEQEGDLKKANEYYSAAQQRFSDSGKQQENGQMQERLAVQDEEAKNYGRALERYDQALKSYTIAGDQFGMIRVRTAKERIAALHGAWGHLVDLHTAHIYPLKGTDEFHIGRSTEGSIKNDISFSNRLISRRHIVITRDLTIDDLRSRNGTSINGLLLQYGIGVPLRDKDIIVLADIKAMLFSIKQPVQPILPANPWGIFIDGQSRTYTYLTASEYGLKISGKIIIIESGSHMNAQMKLRWQDQKIEMFETGDEWLALFQVKETDYEYKAYTLAEEEWFEAIPMPLSYVQLSPDRSAILVDGPSFQVISFKEPEGQN